MTPKNTCGRLNEKITSKKLQKKSKNDFSLSARLIRFVSLIDSKNMLRTHRFF